jgi:hypothetical protein
MHGLVRVRVGPGLGVGAGTGHKVVLEGPK